MFSAFKARWDFLIKRPRQILKNVTKGRGSGQGITVLSPVLICFNETSLTPSSVIILFDSRARVRIAFRWDGFLTPCFVECACVCAETLRCGALLLDICAKYVGAGLFCLGFGTHYDLAASIIYVCMGCFLSEGHDLNWRRTQTYHALIMMYFECGFVISRKVKRAGDKRHCGRLDHDLWYRDINTAVLHI